MNFDAHSDILTDVTIRRLRGEKNVFKKYHFERLKKGMVNGTILVIWVDPPYTGNPTSRMLQVLGAACEEMEEMNDCAGVVYKYDDIKKIQDSGRIAVLLGMEGMSGLGGNVSFINVLYRLGVRHGMLTWNEENEFATGAGSPNKERGVTPLGIEALKRMEKLGMVVDVSHSNEKTFWDIYENTEKPFIASHSNVYKLCPVPRNLKDDQIKAVAERGGVIGINAWPDFIDKDEPSAENLLRHVVYIADLVGTDYICFGFDFCDFLSEDTTQSFQAGESASTSGLEDATKIPKFVKMLAEKGFSSDDIEKITHKNIERVIKEVIK
ncbi:MAG: rane dipeptidase [Tepidanaerobacteraceae bacterium]|nr:rane dipeptidase [Tepidanaerobacteraceae bacterium]